VFQKERKKKKEKKIYMKRPTYAHIQMSLASLSEKEPYIHTNEPYRTMLTKEAHVRTRAL